MVVKYFTMTITDYTTVYFCLARNIFKLFHLLRQQTNKKYFLDTTVFCIYNRNVYKHIQAEID